LSAAAENRINVDQSMLEGSKTGKAAEADLMILISKNPSMAELGDEDEVDNQRYLVLAKNKLKGGWHGKIPCELDGARAQYSA